MMPKTTYHREDLRGDLLRAAHAHIADHGHDGLTVRALAQRVKVSAGAPYHHFADRRALLLGLALDGFDKLWRSADAVVAQALPPRERLEQLAFAFLAFQDAHPRLLVLMYESELTRPVIEPRIIDEQLRGFTLLQVSIAEARPGLDPAEAGARAVAFWSAIYGYASLAGKGLLQPLAREGEASFVRWRQALVANATAGALVPPA